LWVSRITCACAERNYVSGTEADLPTTERTMISPGIGAAPLDRLPLRTQLAALAAEWWRRLQSRYEIERLTERDLADMRLTRLDAVKETQKPCWQA
jgi:uncharacterized protein YjiS (DUF1127 family)